MFLAAANLPHPWTQIVRDGPPKEIPCIIKNRFGRGSKDVNVVTEDTVDFFLQRRPDDIWQEYLQPDDQEYTCGMYGCTDGNVRTIIMRRKLGGGMTIAGEVVENTEIESFLEALAEKLHLRGAINAQSERLPIW